VYLESRTITRVGNFSPVKNSSKYFHHLIVLCFTILFVHYASRCKFFQWLTVEQQWVTVEQEKKKENNLELAREAAKNVYLKNIEQAIERIRTRAPTHPGRIRGHNSPTHPGSSFCNVSVNVKSQNVEFHLKMWDNHNSSIV